MLDKPFCINEAKFFKKIVFLFSMLFFYIFIVQVPLLIVIYVAIVSIFSILFFARLRLVPVDFLLLLAIVFFIMFPGLLKADQGVSKVFYFYMEIVIFVFCWIASFEPKLLLKAVNTAFYTFAVFVSVSLFFVWGNPEPLGLIIPGSSQNGIPSYFIVLVSVILFLSFYLNNKFPLIPVVFTFVVSFLGEGRGSLIVSAYIVLCVTFFGFFYPSKKSILIKIVVNSLIVALAVFLIWYAYDLYDFIQSRTKLSVGVLDYNRARILDSYLSSLSGFDWFIGAGYEQTVIDTEYNSNPHISYVRLHSFFGIAAVFFVLLSPLLVFLKGMNFSNLYLVMLLYAMILRAATEPVLFPTLFDFFYFSCLFVFFQKNRG